VPTRHRSPTISECAVTRWNNANTALNDLRHNGGGVYDSAQRRWVYRNAADAAEHDILQARKAAAWGDIPVRVQQQLQPPFRPRRKQLATKAVSNRAARR
jgi:hypothetical protein